MKDKTKQIVLHQSVTKFDNLQSVHIEKIWRAFSSEATNCAVSKKDLLTYLSPLQSWIVQSTFGHGSFDASAPEAKQEYERQVGGLFDHWLNFTNDEARQSNMDQEYLDFMEIFYALVFTSKMRLEEKIEYLFQCMDCDCDSDIEVEEVILGMKSCEAGLAR